MVLDKVSEVVLNLHHSLNTDMGCDNWTSEPVL